MQISNIKIEKGRAAIVDKQGETISGSVVAVKTMKRFVSIGEDALLYVIHAASAHLPLHCARHLLFRLVGVKIGSGATVHMGCKFFKPSGVSIGKDSKIGEGAFLDGRGGIKIGDHVDFASEVMIYTSEHDLDSDDFHAIEDGVILGDYVFVGPRAIILPGVNVGKGAVVAAGAVVTKDVEEFSIVGGVPAKPIGERKNKNPKYKLGSARLFR